MDGKKIYVSVDLVNNVVSHDIPSKMREIFGFDYEKDEFHEIQTGFGKADSEPIDIDEAISILQDLKNKNSTHVQIEYDSDHQEYIFSGMKIELATEESITKYKTYCDERKKLEDNIATKRLEISELNKQLQNL